MFKTLVNLFKTPKPAAVLSPVAQPAPAPTPAQAPAPVLSPPPIAPPTTPQSAGRSIERNLNDGLTRVYDCNGQARNLGPVLNRGGEGVVYRISEQEGVLVKVYSRQNQARENRAKLEAMLNMQTLRASEGLAWPKMAVYDAPGGDLIGFGMRMGKGFSLHTLGNPVLVRERLPGWTRIDSLDVCLSFVRGLRFLHRHGVLVGDLNPGNVLFDTVRKEVTFIDCDSYQIPQPGGSGSYLCSVGIQQFMAPEALDLNWRRTPRTLEQEHFAMAILLFRILMLGGHPYACVMGEDPVQNLRKGLCPLGTGTNLRMPKGPWYNIWSHMPFRLKSLFIQTFQDGHRKTTARPTSNDYANELGQYISLIRKGHMSNELIPAHPKSNDWHTASSTPPNRN